MVFSRFTREFPLLRWVVACMRSFIFAQNRCRTADAHDGMTCEQKEAQRGFDEVLICPGCGVYMVKGDGERRNVSRVTSCTI